MYNAYLPHQGPYEKIPEDTPPGPGFFHSPKGKEGIFDFLHRFGAADTGDLILLLLLYELLREGGRGDGLLLLSLAAALLLDDGKGEESSD
jgi:hypothetical protein